ncbi:hypothetical protein ABC345_21255 [Shouchella sp. 1P09AA]|uniref:hypothetical protein n=1 Tax=unclassified Shouchella TaxID=2893065 RepID=UPI0039A37268
MVNTAIKFDFIVDDDGLMMCRFSKGIYKKNTFEKIRSHELEDYQLVIFNLLSLIKEAGVPIVIINGDERLKPVITYMEETFANKSFIINLHNHKTRNTANNPYTRGFNLLISGIYPKNLFYSGIKHFVNQDLSNKDFQSIMLEQNINSSIINNKVMNNKNNSYGLEKIELIKISDRTYSVDFIHTQVNKKMTVVSFSERKSRSPFHIRDEEITTVVFNNEKDILNYGKYIEEINKKGTLKVEEIYYLIKDECMWNPEEFCTRSTKIRHLETKGENFLSNFNCFSDLKVNEINQSRKNSCVLFASDKRLTSTYNNVIKENVFVKEFVKIRNILRSFIYSSKFNISNIEIKFNTLRKTHFFKLDKELYIQRNYLIFSIEKHSYVYIKMTNKFYIITANITMILEVFMYVNSYQKASGILNISSSTLKNIIRSLNNKLNINLEIEE